MDEGKGQREPNPETKEGRSRGKERLGAGTWEKGSRLDHLFEGGGLGVPVITDRDRDRARGAFLCGREDETSSKLVWFVSDGLPWAVRLDDTEAVHDKKRRAGLCLGTEVEDDVPDTPSEKVEGLDDELLACWLGVERGKGVQSQRRRR